MVDWCVYFVYSLAFWSWGDLFACFWDCWLERKIIVLYWFLLGISFGFVKLKSSEPELLIFFLEVDIVLGFCRILNFKMFYRSYFHDNGQNDNKMVDVMAHNEFLPQLSYQIYSFSLVRLIVTPDHFKLFQTFQVLNVFNFMFQK